MKIHMAYERAAIIGPLLLMSINLVIIIYFALPRRRPFLIVACDGGRRTTLWLTFLVSFLMPSLEHPGVLKTKILNISESGAFMEMGPDSTPTATSVLTLKDTEVNFLSQ